MDKQYNLTFNYLLEDPEWDEFILRCDDGHYTQLSSWAKVRTVLGWSSIRIGYKQNDQLIAGAQILYRPIKYKIFGHFGYLSKGPVFLNNNPDKELIELLLDSIKRICSEKKMLMLGIQPPDYGYYLIKPLQDMKCFEIVGENINPPGTAITDLSLSLDDIFGNFKKQTRYDIRHSSQNGMTVRQGFDEDLPIFYDCLRSTGNRQSFHPEEFDYIATVWDEFSTDGHIALFIAEFQNIPVSAIMLICFNNTVIYWRGGWTGYHSNLCPNELMHWTAIQWAKQKGYLYYDMGGLTYGATKELLRNNKLPQHMKNSVSSFKIKFRTDIVLYPCTYYYVPNPLLRPVIKNLFPIIGDNKLIQKAIDLFRNH